MDEIESAYKSGDYDVFVFDDLSRLIRGGEAARLLGVGVDNDTRSICIDDGIDTIDETWEEDALNACSENVAHNQRTSKRIKQKMMNRFKKSAQLKQLEAEVAQVAREKENLLAAIKTFGPKEMIVHEIEAIESRERDLARRRYLIEKAVKKPRLLPKSVAELRAKLEAQFQPLNVESFEFGALLRQIVPEFHVDLVRLIDGGQHDRT